MMDLKPYGAFVENTIRPLLAEIKVLLDEYGFDVPKWTKLVRLVGWFHLGQTLIKSISETISIIAVVYFLCKNFQL